jgi:ribosomal protein L37AE/L43A
MDEPLECPNCGSTNIGIKPDIQMWICFECGYRIEIAYPPMGDPYFFNNQ